ncbi:TetR/AcrR family transcriptional regulator [Nocardia vermiculata]|uniref:TetR/AcrR family transcriptional regulator n=1 Tax=Nocardia vermiculata TaxID=257274 RepID=A0A846Y0L8_9NOCA|nr:TetR/AcrR family transcriptional regulator [Nocardia vermiculata]NKY52823.1 TetR/AcrR family transcriptional regulator [Nocardia vermiculata]
MDSRTARAKQERRRVIMAAAAGLFAACGYRAASMDEIACRAGISKPVLYKSFSSKLELYLAVLHDAVQVLGETLTTALDRAEDMRSIVAATVAAVFDFADIHPRAAALLAGAGVADEPSAQHIAHQAAQICATALDRALAPYPFARPEQNWLITAELVAIAQSCAQDWAITGKHLRKSDAVATTVSLCWGGLAGVQLTSTQPETDAPAPISGARS